MDELLVVSGVRTTYRTGNGAAPARDRTVARGEIAGCGLDACQASVDVFRFEKNDFIPPVKDIITVGEFYAVADGGQIVFT